VGRSCTMKVVVSRSQGCGRRRKARARFKGLLSARANAASEFMEWECRNSTGTMNLFESNLRIGIFMCKCWAVIVIKRSVNNPLFSHRARDLALRVVLL
jgi:hypothetical protein